MNGIVNGMRTTIDRAGRIVVPKPIRDALGLVEGTVLEVSDRDGSVVIEVAPVEKRLVKRGKGVVVEPVGAGEPLPVLTAEAVRKALEESRR